MNWSEVITKTVFFSDFFGRLATSAAKIMIMLLELSNQTNRWLPKIYWRASNHQKNLTEGSVGQFLFFSWRTQLTATNRPYLAEVPNVGLNYSIWVMIHHQHYLLHTTFVTQFWVQCIADVSYLIWALGAEWRLKHQLYYCTTFLCENYDDTDVALWKILFGSSQPHNIGSDIAGWWRGIPYWIE